MPVNYTPSAPVAGAARNVSPTEVERWTDYADTIGDVRDRIYPGQIIASTVYAPAAPVTMSTTSLTPVPASEANLSVTFTFPPSGKVVVALNARGYSGVQWGWALTEAGVVVPGSITPIPVHATLHGRASILLPFTGVAGTTTTWAWAFYSQSAGTTSLYAGPGTATSGTGRAYMQVQAG